MEALRKIYGDDFLGHVLNLDDLEVPEESLSDGQREAVACLRLASRREPGDNDALFHFNVAARVGHYITEVGTNLCTFARQHSTGKSLQIEGDDSLLTHLWNLGSQIWPIFLLPRQGEREPHLMSLGSFTFNHPIALAVWQSILRDRSLRRLFKHAPSRVDDMRSATEISSWITYSTGHSGTLQLVMLPDVMLTVARYRQLLHGSNDLGSYLQEIAAVLDEARQLSRRQDIRVPYFLGLSNMQLPADEIASTPFGTIRPVRDTDQTLISISNNAGSHVTAVIEASHPCKILEIIPTQDAADDFDRLERLRGTFDDCREQAELEVVACRLSLLLASDQTMLIAPAVVSRALLDTFNMYPLQTWRSQPPQPSGVSLLDAASVERATEWSKRLTLGNVRRLKIGARRILSAASDRGDLLDSLIDAVICWENMFGSTPDTAFRICGAMACLMQPEDRDAREELLRKLKRVYSRRSDIVHGRTELPAYKVQEYRDTAIKFGLEALRLLLVNSDLMAIQESSLRAELLLRAGGYLD
ncbi:HEPN domain-containing protein [Frankia sp. BMG5.23]|uniref:HEPN domain-containing protein n=1 Tax=Frankia sp. BMG5.23 TaxID=683305 RepID=UPI00046105CE|nr:HEPN domain-containing protein [Frankia sp. BMG5.23]KDA44543.1 hypothetical protein BMG523Draft_00720 [Frankia sp. BMG5.23]